jgi:hypothetical protein
VDKTPKTTQDNSKQGDVGTPLCFNEQGAPALPHPEEDATPSILRLCKFTAKYTLKSCALEEGLHIVIRLSGIIKGGGKRKKRLLLFKKEQRAYVAAC